MPELKPASQLSRKARRFQAVLDEYRLASQVYEFDQPARTAQQAADVIGCELDQIVKSLLMRSADERPLLVLTAGGNRADETLIGRAIGSEVAMADAAFVRAHAGYAIGGVPPFGHPAPLDTLVDEDLFRFDEVWAAGGIPNAVFPIAPQRLLALTGGRRARVAESRPPAES